MSMSTDSTIVHRPLATLKPSRGNPRTHSRRQIQQISNSIREFGFINPVLIDQAGRVIAGHGRLEAAKLLGMETVPTVTVGHLTPAQIRAYIIADNKIAANAGWDDTLLALDLKELADLFDYDLTVTGFEKPEVDILFQACEPRRNEDEAPSIDTSKPAVARRGDLWRIGDHLVLCGDSTERASYERLLGNELVRMVFTDAPYNVPVQGHVSGNGKHQHREFAMASGEMSQEDFTGFLKTVFAHMADVSMDGSLHYLCMDWRHMWEVMAAAKGTYQELKNLCVWVKSNGGMGAFYRSQHELVFLYKKGTAAHINNVELGRHGRNRTNVWQFAGANSFGANRDTDLAMHPTVKPVDLVSEAILDASERDDLVLDVFGGSGTTLVAAAQTGRRGRAIEIDPYYVDTIVRRMQEILKTDAVLIGDGDTFNLVRAWREAVPD